MSIFINFFDFFEIILLACVFYSVSKYLSLGKGKYIFFSSCFGLSMALIAIKLNYLHLFMPIVSLLFTAWIVISLYRYVANAKNALKNKNYKNFSYVEFDLLLFFTTISFLFFIVT